MHYMDYQKLVEKVDDFSEKSKSNEFRKLNGYYMFTPKSKTLIRLD